MSERNLKVVWLTSSARIIQIGSDVGVIYPGSDQIDFQAAHRFGTAVISTSLIIPKSTPVEPAQQTESKT